ncbi:hypothetical protein J6590_095529 [Homalodisca vitripennis]|nr:hypothetical protein J6590_095529 [Homalodisca vitripennis]
MKYQDHVPEHLIRQVIFSITHCELHIPRLLHPILRRFPNYLSEYSVICQCKCQRQTHSLRCNFTSQSSYTIGGTRGTRLCSTTSLVYDLQQWLSSRRMQYFKDFKQLSEEIKALRSDIAGFTRKSSRAGSVGEKDEPGNPCDRPRSRRNIPALLKEVARKIGVIHRAHRLQNRRNVKPSTILVQFMSAAERDEWRRTVKKVRIMKIYFNENICPEYRTFGD